MRSANGRWIEPALVGAIAELLFAAMLAAFLLAATDSRGDAVPRPVVLLILYAAPGVVGLLGAVFRRRSLLVAAALPLVPGSVLSFTGVTLIFLLPALLMVVGAARIGSKRRTSGISVGGVAITVAIAALIVAAGWSMLLRFTSQGCQSIPNGTSCGTGLITAEGVAVGISLLVAALALAWWWAGRKGSETA